MNDLFIQSLRFRDLNQLLYKVFNAKKVHTYVTMPDEPVGSTNSPYSPLGSVKTVQTSVGSEMEDLDSEDNLQSFGTLPATSNTLVPMFERFMKDHMPNLSMQGSSWADSSQNLISRSGSSMDYGSLPTTYSYRSQLTMQTSISNWSLMTMPSIYCIEGYQITLNKDRPLGEGNFGIVYKGVWTRSNDDWDEVAVKMLKDLNDPASESELERELSMMSRLEHENIVKIRGTMRVPESGNLAFVMEYVREGSLDNYLRTNQCPIKQLFIFADNICDGMVYLSSEGIIHRDLAARNVLVANEEQVKISDFGLARQSREKDYYQMTSNTNIPVKWMAIGQASHQRTF